MHLWKEYEFNSSEYVTMVNSKHSVKLKSTPKKGIRSNSRNMNYSQAAPTTSGTNEAEKPLNETVKKIFV